MNDYVKRINVIKFKIKTLQDQSYILEKQKREFGNYIQLYMNKRSRSYVSEIDRYKRYLVRTDDKIKNNQIKREELEFELSQLMPLTGK